MANYISKIVIENIRGFKCETLDLSIYPNRPNILVAPNGFGKSSLSTAFKCAQERTFKIKQTDKFNHDEDLNAKLKIEVDGCCYVADKNKNHISKWASIYVIKSSILPKAKVQTYSGRSVANASMEIPDLVLGKVPDTVVLEYDLSEERSLLKPNGKVHPNLKELCAKNNMPSALLSALPDIKKIQSQIGSKNLFSQVSDFIINLSGNKAQINTCVEKEFKQKAENIRPIGILISAIQRVNEDLSWTDALMLCFQLSKLNGPNLKKWLERAAFDAFKKRAKEFIKDINVGWVKAKFIEKRDHLIITFPNASMLSNAEQDLLFFACNLLKVLHQSPSKNLIVIIDEVFDYLDDGNIVVAQYFLSKLIENFKKEEVSDLYLIILTHLDPKFFKGYALKKQNVVYLGDDTHKVTTTMKTIIGNRTDESWKCELERYFLHYHPDNHDISQIFNEKFGLKTVHGKSHGFYNFLEGEWDKLKSGKVEFDPFAICAFLRVSIEKKIYEDITESDCKSGFLEKHGTKNKIKYAETHDINVPEIFLLLGSIYNDAMHQKVALEQGSTIGLKLKNKSLLSMIDSAINTSIS